MINGISSSAAHYASVYAQVSPSQQIAAVGSSQSGARGPSTVSDSVSLSAVAQAHSMQQQGMAVKAIAASMGTTTETVDGYLGISTGESGGSGGGGTTEIQKIASKVRVNPPANGIAS